MKQLDNFYFSQEEPYQSCFLALRDIILSVDKQITPEWKFGLPFFYYRGKMLCFLNYSKKYRKPYIGLMKGSFLEGDDLLAEGRKLAKIMLIDPEQDLPINRVNELVLLSINSMIKV